jgi:3-oxoacyl-[acyl-carrier protein] reductase
VSALVACHCESVASSILDTTPESFDRHMAVNARSTWLLVRELALRFRDAALEPGTGRVVALTSDHTAHHLPYGASKGALERIVVAAAEELGGLGITSNALNPGPVDTGWMDDDVRRSALEATPLRRAGTPQDTADLVEFLLSPRGGWVTGQVLFSNGGFRTHR